MKLIRCKSCEDVVRLIHTKWRICDCEKSGGQYNKDLMTATVGGDCEIVGLSNLFFDKNYNKLSDEEKDEHKKEINHNSCEVWFGEGLGDKQIHRIKSPKGPRLKMELEYVGKSCVITFTDKRDYSINLKGNKKPKTITIEDNPKPNPSFNDKKARKTIKESSEKNSIRLLVRECVSETLEEYITRRELRSIDNYANNLFSDVNVDVEFNTHFLERLNDPRNVKDIESEEIKELFKKTYLKYGQKIPEFRNGTEAVITDFNTNINIPFRLEWNKEEGKYELISKSVMRKKNYQSPGMKLKV